MSIRTKTLIAVGLSMSGLILAITLFFWKYVHENLTREEKRAALYGMQIVQTLLSDDLDQLDRLAADWAEWDDTYAFIQDRNSNYIRSNLIGDTYQNLLLNLMLFVDNRGQVVYGDAYDLEHGEVLDWPSELSDHLKQGGLLVREGDEPRKGILILAEGPMLIVARPILTSEGLGPGRGTFLLGRYLDQAQVERLSRLSNYQVTIKRAETSDLAEDFAAAQAELLSGATLFVQPGDESVFYAYGLLKDIYNKPALIIRLDMPRQDYHQALVNFRYLLVSQIITGVVFILLTLVLLERTVLARLALLNDQVIQIGQKADLSQRVSLGGKDELARLALVINETMEALQHSRRALDESEQRFRQLVENAPVVIYTAEITPEGDLAFSTLNPAFEKLTGWSPDEWYGKTVTALIESDDQPAISEMHQTVLQGQSHGFCEVNLRSRGGEAIPCEITNTPLMKGGSAIGVIGIIHDVAAHKRLEEQMRASILEREALLREIHHRVKNNLQIVSSILNLQASRCRDEQSKLVFQEAQNRVRSMALIHEKLYRSPNLAQVNLGEYLQHLVEEIARVFRNYAPRVRVTVNHSDVTLDMDRAISCGLIVTELVTNAYKHAFPSNQSGQIEVSLCDDESGSVVLQIADTGRGLPEDAYLNKGDSLGLQLVDVLVRQLNGHLEVHRQGGSRFVITFARKESSG